MPNQDLDILFQEAVAIADQMTQSELPQDVQLRLYAYYKQATYGTIDSRISTPSFDLRNAFKTNAWMQISHLSTDDAKKEYINIINSIQKK